MALSPSQPIRTSAVSIIKAVAAQLLAYFSATGGSGFVMDKSGIYLSTRAMPPHFQAEHELIVKPYGWRLDSPLDYSGGRQTTKLVRRLGVTVRTRALLDEAFKDAVWFQGDGALVLGHSALEEAVLDALQEFWPEDSSRNVLTTEPIKNIEGNDPNKETSDENAWGYSIQFYSFVYLPPLNQAVR